MRIALYRLLSFTVFLALPSVLLAQVLNTESPYSAFGLGDFVAGYYSRSAGMGGVAQGMRDGRSVNPSNPASFTTPDSFTFVLDLAMRVDARNYTSASASKPDASASVHHIAIQFPVTRWGGGALGVQPYTQTGYDFTRYETDQRLVSDIGRIRYHHRGSGGINDAFIGLAGKPLSFFSLGVNAHFLFGSINHQQDGYIPTNRYYADFTYTNRSVVRGMRMSAGAQFHFAFASEHARQLNVGFTYDFYPVFSVDNRLELKQVYLNQELSVARNYQRVHRSLRLPPRYSGGVAYQDAQWLVGGDFAYQDWTGFSLYGADEHMGKSFDASIGVQWQPNGTDLRSYAKRIQYRLGAYYSRTPVVLASEKINDMGITVGFGLPYRRSYSLANLALAVGVRGTKAKALVRETYIRLTLGVSLNDFWFVKRQYD